MHKVGRTVRHNQGIQATQSTTAFSARCCSLERFSIGLDVVPSMLWAPDTYCYLTRQAKADAQIVPYDWQLMADY